MFHTVPDSKIQSENSGFDLKYYKMLLNFESKAKFKKIREKSEKNPAKSGKTGKSEKNPETGKN